jgi:hypothetical protein
LEDTHAKVKAEKEKALQEQQKRITKDAQSRKWKRHFDERISKAREKHDIDGAE